MVHLFSNLQTSRISASSNNNSLLFNLDILVSRLNFSVKNSRDKISLAKFPEKNCKKNLISDSVLYAMYNFEYYIGLLVGLEGV